jgi:hypothetical protein
MQNLRIDNMRGQVLRDDLTAERFEGLRMLASTALESALSHGDMPRAVLFIELGQRATERLHESSAYQSAAVFNAEEQHFDIVA